MTEPRRPNSANDFPTRLVVLIVAKILLVAAVTAAALKYYGLW